ncbi:MAG: nickel pincer cofactor biosynthesis protein LarC [Candidatus Helarchaeota archaeon]|nr:nickel pincer cofactor biosynthesis protein LarC [Candidatus Helarchaeota archaeon]
MVNKPNTAIIDCQTTGISGDKFLGALIDLGVNIEKIQSKISIISNYLEGVSEISLSLINNSIYQFNAKRIQIKFSEKSKHRTGNELIKITEACLNDLKLSDMAKEYALSVVQILINTEAKIHNTTIEKVHLHETGSADTLVDSIGSAIALESLNLFNNVTWFVLPVAIGSGKIKFSHGLISAPAPATLEILSSNNIEITGGDITEELTTPTGAAIMASLKIKSISRLPNMKIKSIGYGAGTKTFPNIPNIMRIITGYQKEIFSNTDEIVILETNLDDVSGEILGHTIKKLIDEGHAKDVCIIPTITKKNRPGHILKVITDSINEEELIKMLMKETGTLGVRVYPCKRFVLNREMKEIEIDLDNKKWKINIKIVKNLKGEIIQIKPEFDDLINIAKNTNNSARIIEKIATKKIRSLFFENK